MGTVLLISFYIKIGVTFFVNEATLGSGGKRNK
jgi:hypothetical protein